MTHQPRGEAVLITGVYGSGKSSVAVEIADIIEEQGIPYAVVDLDFLGWYGTETSDTHSDPTVLLRNLSAVVGNFADAGVRFFVLAGFISSQTELHGIRLALPVPMRVVRLTLPFDEVTRRLADDPTSGRQDDLREAASQIASGEGVGLEDLTVSNERPIRQVAAEIVSWLGWG